MPPFVIWLVGALGGAALLKALAREHARVNDELDARRGAGLSREEREQLARDQASAARKSARAENSRTLRRDPATGRYRPE